jgi:hypothetical protein
MKPQISVVVLIGSCYRDEYQYLEKAGLELRAYDVLFENEEPKLGSYISNFSVEIIVGSKEVLDINSIASFLKHDALITKFSDTDNDAYCYNELFRQCKGDYICVFRPYVHLEENWLLEVFYYATNIDKAGIASIVNDPSFCAYVPLLDVDHENTFGVFIPEEETVAQKSIIFFNRQLLYLTGALDESLPTYAWRQFEMRTSRLGYNNFFIGSQACCSLFDGDNISAATLAELKMHVTNRVKDKALYIPLER